MGAGQGREAVSSTREAKGSRQALQLRCVVLIQTHLAEGQRPGPQAAGGTGREAVSSRLRRVRAQELGRGRQASTLYFSLSPVPRHESKRFPLGTSATFIFTRGGTRKLPAAAADQNEKVCIDIECKKKLSSRYFFLQNLT